MSEAAIVLLVVFCLVGFAILVVHQRNIAMAKKCIDNLRSIDGAKEAWVLETYNQTNSSMPLSAPHQQQWEDALSNTVPTLKEIIPYINEYIPDRGYVMPQCPQGGIYTIGRVGELPTCSIPSHRLPGIPFRLFVEDEKGSWLSGVSVEVIDSNGRRLKSFTDTNGTVEVGSYSTNKAIAVILSKNGYNTISNSLPLPPEAFGVGGVRLRKSKSDHPQ